LIKIVAVSDSHGNSSCLDKIISIESPFDYLIHCGDGISDLENILLPEKSIFICVSGNVDSYSNIKCKDTVFEEVLEMEFMITHGDFYSVKSGLADIKKAGLENKADVLLFGHTHKQYLKIEDDIILFNPGACANGFYGIINIGKTAEFLHKQIIC
jgi:hypothetical protein